MVLALIAAFSAFTGVLMIIMSLSGRRQTAVEARVQRLASNFPEAPQTSRPGAHCSTKEHYDFARATGDTGGRRAGSRH